MTPALILRRAIPEDRALLWEWANDPVTRSAGFHPDAIPWEAHVAWFDARLADPDTVFYVVEDGDGPAGQIRFHVDDRVAEIHVSIAPERRGRGYGGPAIEEGAAALFAECDVEEIVAHVRPDNDRSLRSFRRAGFTPAGEVTVDGHTAIRLVLPRVTR